ncbi:MAG: urea transporter, permease protein UrtC [Pseudonocardiales bacterium]|nr:urea transporter, permease protein UrtC [Jatrophihabitantaceae bacterium]MCW2603937.1 urea transporter, permease protein UrtC [Pseudonocardiales bacterium]
MKRLVPLLAYLLLAGALLLLAPAILTDFRLSLLSRFCTFAIVAVGIGLAWGRGGMLTLGQGLFFGLGAYVMAMHMKLDDAGPGGVPDFMKLYGDGKTPGWWEPFRSPIVTLLGIILVPAIVATVLGLAVFKRRVKGAYFAILSQALTAAFAILLIGQQGTTGGFNGLNGFKSFFGYAVNDPVNRRLIYFLTAIILLVILAGMAQLYRSRFGELLVAVRDGEERVRFLGYDPANIKLVAYVVSAVLAGIGGALFVPIAGIISPSDVGVVPSIAFVIGVAMGGRTTLLGPAVGAIAVAWAQTSLSENFPSFWSYFQGGLFVIVILFLPGGIAQLPTMATRLRRRPKPPADPSPIPQPRAAEPRAAEPRAAEPATTSAPATGAVA